MLPDRKQRESADGTNIFSEVSAMLPLGACRYVFTLIGFFSCVSISIDRVSLCFAVGYVSAQYVLLPWSIQAGMCAAAFLYLGYLAKKYDVLGLVKRFPFAWAIAFIIWVVDITFFGGMSMAVNNYGSRPVLAVIGSIAGTLCVVGISQLIDRVPAMGSVLSRIGQASLAILCVHLIEDDVLPWQMYLGTLRMLFPQIPLVLLSFIVRLPFDLIGAALLYHVPVINEWFYPQLAKRKFEASSGIKY